MTPPSPSASCTLKFSMRFSAAVCFCRRFVPMASGCAGGFLEGCCGNGQRRVLLR